MSSHFIRNLQASVEAQWAEIKQGAAWRRLMEQPVTGDLYRDLMLQVWHCSRHNSMNQAVTAFVPAPEGLLKYVYRQAAEELGHERRVVHDLKSVGLFDDIHLERAPLPATEALIGYLYAAAMRYGAVARLGYSFWAEDAHRHLGELITKIGADLGLDRKDMTFFGMHAEADLVHMLQVEEALESFATCAQLQELVRRVAMTSLFLTGQLLEQVVRLHRRNGVAACTA